MTARFHSNVIDSLVRLNSTTFGPRQATNGISLMTCSIELQRQQKLNEHLNVSDWITMVSTLNDLNIEGKFVAFFLYLKPETAWRFFFGPISLRHSPFALILLTASDGFHN